MGKGGIIGVTGTIALLLLFEYRKVKNKKGVKKKQLNKKKLKWRIFLILFFSFVIIPIIFYVGGLFKDNSFWFNVLIVAPPMIAIPFFTLTQQKIQHAVLEEKRKLLEKKRPYFICLCNCIFLDRNYY